MVYKNLKKALSEREQVLILKISLQEKNIPDELFCFPHLSELYLEANHLESWPKDLSGWSKLKVLQIRAPRLRDSLCTLFELPRLENLKTSETPLEPLRLPFGGIRSPIRYLTLKGAALKSLPEEFGEFKDLEELTLAQNKLSSFPQSVKFLSNLKRLNLDQNEFKIFPDILAQLAKLKHVSIDHNSFSQEEKDRIQRVYHLSLN
jgi:Leucine-rich repeat (LRR) protein